METYLLLHKYSLYSAVTTSCFTTAQMVWYLRAEGRSKVIPAQVWTGSGGHRRFRLMDLRTFGI